MANPILAIVIACIALAAFLGYTYGRRDTEEEYHAAARAEHLAELDNRRRFADIERQGRTI